MRQVATTNPLFYQTPQSLGKVLYCIHSFTPHAQDTQRTKIAWEGGHQGLLFVPKNVKDTAGVSVTAPVNTEPWHSSLATEGDSLAL